MLLIFSRVSPRLPLRNRTTQIPARKIEYPSRLDSSVSSFVLSEVLLLFPLLLDSAGTDPGRVSWATSTTTPNERPQKNSSNLSPSVAYYQSPRQSQIGLLDPSLNPCIFFLFLFLLSFFLCFFFFFFFFLSWLTSSSPMEGATTHAASDPRNRICKWDWVRRGWRDVRTFFLAEKLAEEPHRPERVSFTREHSHLHFCCSSSVYFSALSSFAHHFGGCFDGVIATTMRVCDIVRDTRPGQNSIPNSIRSLDT